MNKILYYLSYPIRYVLKHKVDRYKRELEYLRFNQKHIKPKSRRSGMIEYTMDFVTGDIFLASKYENYINKWEIKDNNVTYFYNHKEKEVVKLIKNKE